MKNTCLLFIIMIITSCENMSQNHTSKLLTGEENKYWFIDFKHDFSNEGWKTIWRFSNDGSYYGFYYNQISKEVRIKDNGDNIEPNTFELKSNDTLVLNGSPFPILNLSYDSIILKNIYGENYHPKAEIQLKHCSEKSLIDCNLLLIKIDFLINNLGN